MRFNIVHLLILVSILSSSNAKKSEKDLSEGQSKAKGIARAKRAPWTLNDPDLSTKNSRAKISFKGPRKLSWVKFFMSINEKFDRFSDCDYQFKLRCNRAKLCRKVGGPALNPGDVVYYGMQAKLRRKRQKLSFLGRTWIPFPITSGSPTTTTTSQPDTTETTPQPGTTPDLVTCSHLESSTVPSACTENLYTVPTGYPTAGTRVRNPERGFYKHTETLTSSWTPLTSSELQSYMNDGYTIIYRNFVLDTFANSNISDAILQSIRNDFITIRNAGVKLIVRFCYSLVQTNINDAPPLQLQKHIEQLAPILQENVDVIHLVQAGFIGVWGEWYYTANYGNEGNLSPTDWENRRQVVYQLLNALPTSRQVQIRTPNYKMTLLGRTSSVTSAEAHTDARVARLGHHNDCFLASDADWGTYLDKAIEYPYLQNETLYVAQGGESCNPNSPRSDCPTALKELSELHFNYLNSGYHPAVLQSWVTQGCFDQVAASLGYRLVGVKSRYPSQVARGSEIQVGLRIKNIGWASPVNYRSAQLVLRSASSSEEHLFPIKSDLDLRKWVPGDYDLELTLTVPATASTGEYKLYLKLPDGETSLQSMPDYNIQMENLVDSSVASLRLNLLGTVTVT